MSTEKVERAINALIADIDRASQEPRELTDHVKALDAIAVRYSKPVMIGALIKLCDERRTS